jgi:methionine sulfoxide reductase heme-binding subunit
MLQHGFGLANLLGVVAVFYAILLLATSNDRSIRALGAPVWKFLQNGAVVLWALVVLHTGYFLFLHFLSFHRPIPDANPLQWPFIGVVASVFVLRAAAFVATWRRRRGAGGTATGSVAIS